MRYQNLFTLFRFLLFTFPLIISACNISATPQEISIATIFPASTVLPTVTSAPPSHTPIPIPARPAYTLNTTIDYDAHIVSVDETILYPNHTGQSLDKLVLAVAPNYWPSCFSLTILSIDNTPITDYTLNVNTHRLDVPLPTPLAPDSVATVTLSYKLFLPFLDQENSLRARIFGYSNIQMNLVNWYPFIVPFIDGEWIIREPWSHGEYLVYPVADFEVNLKFANPENVPVVATSGFAEPNGEFTRYTITEARAFAISASREFQVSSMQVGDTTVHSYYLPIYKQAGLAAMNASAQAVQVFSQRFGLYPHKTLSIVMADFKDSMEFSALYFHSRSFYDLYNGAPNDYLTFVAVHETGHLITLHI